MAREDAAPAQRYRFVDGVGEIGVISSVSQPFCGTCNRLRLTADGAVRNGYTIKVLNMVRKQGRFLLTVDGVADATLNVIGLDGDGLKQIELPVPPDSVGSFRVFVTAPKSAVAGSSVPMTVSVIDQDNGTVQTHRNLFAGPGQE